MKKLIMILSALLCLAMLFASCTSKPTEEPAEESTTPAETVETTVPETELETEPEPIPNELKIDYDAIIARWNEYISFEDETGDDVNLNATLSELFKQTSHQNDYSDFSEDFDVQQFGNLVLFSYHSTAYDTVYDAYENTYEDVRIHNYRYNIFNIVTGEKITSTQYTYRYYPYRDGAERYAYSNVQSTPSLNHTSYGVIRMDVTTYKYIPEETDELGFVEAPAEWESKTTYDYYDLNGKLLVENLESNDFEEVSTGFAYQTIIRIGDEYFLVKDGEIVAELGEEMQVKLDFGIEEYNGFQYVWDDENGSVRVLDTATNRVTVDWNYEEYFDQRDGDLLTYILGNGNILFEMNYETWEGEGILWGNAYYDTLYVLVDVKTGELSEVSLTCEIDGVTYEYAILSLINNFNDRSTGLTLKDGNYQLAEIYLISDGIAAPKTTLVILDSELGVVATLDRFLQDQDGIYGVLENGDLLIYTDSFTYYTVDVDGNRTQKVQLSVSPNSIHTYIPGGFHAKNGILYNDSLKPLVNLSQEYTNVTTFENGLKAWSEEDRCYHYLTINSAGDLEIKYTPETGTYLSVLNYNGCTVYKTVNPDAWRGSNVPYVYTVCNAQGQTIKTLYGQSCTITNGMLKLTSGSTSTYYILK